MTKKDKQLLLSQAMRLYTLGASLDRERLKLKRLVEQGLPCDDPKVLRTLEKCERMGAEWKALEARHLALRKKLGGTSDIM